MSVLHCGERECLKTAVHAALGVLAGVCAIWNLCAYVARRERHLGVNTVLYLSIAALEVVQTRRHCAAHAIPRDAAS